MNFSGYPKQTAREKYSGMWGRISYLLTRRSREDAINECNGKDGVWVAACRMQLRKQTMSIENLSETEAENWAVAMKLASEYTRKKFVENETDSELLQTILKSEASRENPDRDLIGLINKRLQELR